MDRRRIVSMGVLAAGVAFGSCGDPACPGIRLVYSGDQDGPVILVARMEEGGTTIAHIQSYPSVAAARMDLSGTCAVFPGGSRSLFSRDRIDRGMTVRAWIDLDRGEFSGLVCDATHLTADCAPDPGEPQGEIPPPPHSGIIDLVLRDP